MKKLFTIVAAALMSISAINAQNFGVEGVAGMNVSNWGGLGSKVGFHAGARFELAIPSVAGLYTNAGVMLSLKGCKQDYGEVGNATTNAYYLDVPIHVGYKFSITNDFAIFGEVGPYVAIGLFGKSNSETGEFYDENGDWGYSSEKETINTFDFAKRFDVGVGLRVGVEFKKKYSLSIGYDWGFIDSYIDDEEEMDDDYVIDLTPSLKNTNLTISLGYKF